MKKLSVKRLGVLLCTLLLAVIVGCQSVGGLNLNDMIVKQLDVTQLEQSQLIELEFALNEELLAKEEPELIDLVHAFQKVSLNITHSKVDDKGNMWATGVLSFGKGDIPFTLHVDSKAFRLDVGGAKRPLVIDISSMNQGMAPGMGMGVPLNMSEDTQKAMMDSFTQLVKKVAPYFVNSLPNPEVLTVNSVTYPIHGDSTSLVKVHTEMNGEQLGKLIPIYLDNLVKDEEGLRSTLTSVVEWLKELPPELTAMFGGEELFAEYADTKAAVDDAMAEIMPMLKEAQQELANTTKEDDWNEVFDKGITMTADLYVDSSLFLRKSEVEVNIAPAAFTAEEIPFRSIKLRSTVESWNINGKVEVPAVETPINALGAEDLMETEPAEVLQLFEEDSVIYDILKNDLQIDDQSFELSTEWGIPFFVDSKGVAYVPVRQTMKEFGVKLGVPAKKGQIRFYDSATEQAIVLQTGSANATVNGKAVKLKHKVINDGHFAYVSADDLFGLLKAEYKIVKNGSKEQVMEVTRDL